MFRQVRRAPARTSTGRPLNVEYQDVCVTNRGWTDAMVSRERSVCDGIERT